MKEVRLNNGRIANREGERLRPLDSAGLAEQSAPPADAAERCYQRALKLLSIRPRSRSELQTLLRKVKFEPASIETTIERLLQARLVDDTAFAAYWRDNRTEFRPRSRRAVNAELRQKGVSAEVAAEALNPMDDDELAYRAASAKAARWAAFDDETLKAKLLDFLKRRGFGWDTSRGTANRVLEERRAVDAYTVQP